MVERFFWIGMRSPMSVSAISLTTRRNTTAARVSTYAYVNPLVAVFLGWAVLGETLTAQIGLAAAIILATPAFALVPRAVFAELGAATVTRPAPMRSAPRP